MATDAPENKGDALDYVDDKQSNHGCSQLATTTIVYQGFADDGMADYSKMYHFCCSKLHDH